MRVAGQTVRDARGKETNTHEQPASTQSKRKRKSRLGPLCSRRLAAPPVCASPTANGAPKRGCTSQPGLGWHRLAWRGKPTLFCEATTPHHSLIHSLIHSQPTAPSSLHALDGYPLSIWPQDNPQGNATQTCCRQCTVCELVHVIP